MPLYEYECTVCNHRFELLQKFSDEPAKICIRCGAAVHRLLSSPAIQFKGTGWYVTDYGRSGATGDGKKPKSDAAADKSAAPSEPAKSKESSSTSKGASKT